MEKIVDYLKQLDLSDVEAKLYLTLLQTGPTSVRDLAQTVEIKRTTAYFYIDQLVDKGLIMKLVRGSKKLVAANEPENLESLVEAKLVSANEVQKGFPSILKTLNTLPQESHVNDAEIKYYKGKNGVKKIYEDVFLHAKELRSYFNIEVMKSKLPENHNTFLEGLKNNKTMKIFEILEDSAISKEQIMNFQTDNVYQKRYSFKFLPKGIDLSAADILIYDGKVAVINARDQITGIVLQNQDYFNTSRELFDLIWKVLPTK